jgi:23S rRNA pseudouridine1911/1915/1917 synthase
MPRRSNADRPERRSLARDPGARAWIVHVDPHVVVVDKPPGISTARYDGKRGGPAETAPGVAELLGAELGRGELRVVQRLDKDTSGLVVFARTREAQDALISQLRARKVERRYLALAHGDVRRRTFRSFLADDRGDGLRGSVRNPRLGKEAVTHVEPLLRLRGATLVACRLETGRTHQIRIHLAEAGHPVLGDALYQRGCRGRVLPAPRLMLHAETLGFAHPVQERWLEFRRPAPADLARRIAELR